MPKLTKAQRARLDKLATYLEGLPKDYRHFDMADYVLGVEDGDKEATYARHNGGVNACGTAACAVGHGPAAGVLVPPRFVTKLWNGYVDVDWHQYSTLFLGNDGDGYPEENLFEWAFSGGWVSADNHHWGAAARIRYLLDHGAPPKCWDYDPGPYASYRIDAKLRADEAREVAL